MEEKQMTKNLEKEVYKDFHDGLNEVINDIDEAMNDIRFYVTHAMGLDSGIENETYDRICDLFADLMETRNDAVRARRSIYENYLKEEEEDA
jgi:hypothetical protein